MLDNQKMGRILAEASGEFAYPDSVELKQQISSTFCEVFGLVTWK